jgi:thioredoxin 1
MAETETETDADEELRRIRERKRRELADRLSEEGEGGTGTETESEGDGAGAEGSAAPDEPIGFDGGDLAAVAGEYGVALVDFHADWCGPCRAMEPTIGSIAADTDAAVIKVDIDAHGDVAAAHGVRSVPTLMVFADGEPAERVVGARGEGQLRGLVDRHA